MDSEQRRTDVALHSLFQSYAELNTTIIDELYEEPSALEFMRYVAINRPFVIRGGCREWQASRNWCADYLRNSMKDKEVNVAVTPLGYDTNADAVLEQDDGALLFVEPMEQPESFASVLKYIQGLDKTSATGPVKYAQSQNDNMRDEYQALFGDVPKDISWARIALQKDPDAVNFWLGNSRSVTALHKDNYENIYAQIRGQKHFVLLPSIATPCVNEQDLPAAKYTWSSSRYSDSQDDSSRSSDLLAILQIPSETVPCATWDPDEPNERATSLSALAPRINVSLDEGDILYLPAMWYHKVSQTCCDEGYSCAVNYWYDMDFSGQFWPTNAFIRDIGRMPS